MLESIRKGQRWLTALFISVIGLVFVFFLGLGGGSPTGVGPSGNSVVELDDIRLEVSDFQRVRARQEEALRQNAGDQFDARALRDFLDSQALGFLVDGAILSHAAEELGLRVSKQEIQQVLRSDPQLRDENGRFARDQFEDWVEWNYGTQRAFLNVMRQDLMGQKMVRLLYAQAAISDGEARRAALYGLEEVRLAFVALDTETLPPEAALSDAALEAYAAEHEAEIQALFDEQKGDFEAPERVRARHILLRVAEDADEEEVERVRATALETLARIRGGASFEDVALEVSEDPGSRDEGGSLGLFARGETSTELEEAAFSLEPGQISEPVRSDAGFHLVLLEERVAGGSRPFEEVRLELARGPAERAAARERAERLADELSASIAEGRSLEQAARAAGLTLERTGLLRRRGDGFVPGLGPSQELMAVAFGMDLEQPSSPRIFSVGSKLALIQLLERVEPEESVLEAGTEQQRVVLLDRKRNEMVQGWIDARRAMLLEEGRLSVNESLVRGS